NSTTGVLGLLPGSPADVGISIGDVETLAADAALRRVFFGSNESGRIAVVQIGDDGAPAPVAGSPFEAEQGSISVIKVSPTGQNLYVGYHAANLISRYTVDPTGALTLVQTISTGGRERVETMVLLGDVLYVGFLGSSSIIGIRLDGEAFEVDGLGAPVLAADVPTNTRPDYLVALGARLYCSLANDGSVDAFDVGADGSLTRIAGAPYRFDGIGLFELIAVQPGGGLLAVGAETPSGAAALFTINADGSLTPTGEAFVLHDRRGGPEGLTFSADGRFLYVCDHVGQGLYAFDVTGGTLAAAVPPRYELPGKQIDIVRLDVAVAPE
ncbi:MAG: lactonase family protein, partial [Planctomycetota bacterium]|nr:lactonase family protein [Planctomycetota bacterium]